MIKLSFVLTGHYWGPVELAGTASTALRVLTILGIEKILNRPELVVVFPMASPECVPLEKVSRLLELSFISFKPGID